MWGNMGLEGAGLGFSPASRENSTSVSPSFMALGTGPFRPAAGRLAFFMVSHRDLPSSSVGAALVINQSWEMSPGEGEGLMTGSSGRGGGTGNSPGGLLAQQNCLNRRRVLGLGEFLSEPKRVGFASRALRLRPGFKMVYGLEE